jgi:hypothetical protein
MFAKDQSNGRKTVKLSILFVFCSMTAFISSGNSAIIDLDRLNIVKIYITINILLL